MQQRDPGDECDATGCGCGRRPASKIIEGLEDAIAGRGIVHLYLPLIPTPYLPALPPEDYRLLHMGGGTSMTLAEIGEAIGVPGEDLVALIRGEATIVPRAVRREVPEPSDLEGVVQEVIERNRAAYREAKDRWCAQHHVQPEERKP